MTTPLVESPEVAAARLRASAAREQLNGTLGALQARLEPRKVVRDAVGGIAAGSERALDAGVDVAKRHPGRIAAAGALVAAFIGRKRIARALRRHDDDDAQPAPARRVRTSTPPTSPRRNDP